MDLIDWMLFGVFLAILAALGWRWTSETRAMKDRADYHRRMADFWSRAADDMERER